MLEFKVRKVQKFGSDLFYPVCHLTETICHLMNKKSMSKRDIKTLEDSGYRIVLI